MIWDKTTWTYSTGGGGAGGLSHGPFIWQFNAYTIATSFLKMNGKFGRLVKWEIIIYLEYICIYNSVQC